MDRPPLRNRLLYPGTGNLPAYTREFPLPTFAQDDFLPSILKKIRRYQDKGDHKLEFFNSLNNEKTPARFELFALTHDDS